MSDSRTFSLIFKEVLLIIDSSTSFQYGHKSRCFFTRLKTNAVYTVIEVKRVHYRKKDKAKVLRDEIIEMGYHPEDETGRRQLKVVKRLRLRKVKPIISISCKNRVRSIWELKHDCPVYRQYRIKITDLRI